MIRFTLFFVFYLHFLGLYAQDQGEPIEIGKKHIFHSKVLSQERPLMIALPDDYEKDTSKSYPVLYLLDGGGNFHHTSATVNFLAHNKKMPHLIVVGIPNTDDRTRDLTPKSERDEERFPTSGGADDLLRFIRDELINHVDENYRTNEYKLLIGHSFGGLFVIHTLINYPGIFNSYIAISPSLWWDNQTLVLDQSEAFFENQRSLAGHLYITMDGEDGAMLGGAWKLAALLEEKGPKNLHWYFDRMPDETHLSVPQRSTIKGLEFIFDAWNLDAHREAIKSTGIAALSRYEERHLLLYGATPQWSEDQVLAYGDEFLDEESFDLAIPFFRKCSDLFPSSHRAWYGLVTSLKEMGNLDDAKDLAWQAMELNEGNLQVLSLLYHMGEDVSAFLPDVKLTAIDLDKYVGKYELEVGPVLQIMVEGGSLHAEAAILEKEELLPLGSHRFFVASKNSTIAFAAEHDLIKAVTVETPDGNFSGSKIE